MSTTITTGVGIYAPGDNITGEATGTIAAKTFLAISGDRSTTTGGNIAVVTATAAGRVCGVARNSAAAGELVTIARGNSRVVKVTASGTIAAFAEVQVGANGAAVTKTSGIAVGYALTGASSGADAEISLY
ncbi:capsid cement protein [Mycobacterium sp. DL592]|uniref:capsid cement protein n=1 Tax=Mycobacterium sp. DL592 TaxID=2675524 RepID=UPI00141FE6EF|nr:capsid cement protein [Mycobacterium sp. DL592]